MLGASGRRRSGDLATPKTFASHEFSGEADTEECCGEAAATNTRAAYAPRSCPLCVRRHTKFESCSTEMVYKIKAAVGLIQPLAQIKRGLGI
jgi:hypothetical protein